MRLEWVTRLKVSAVGQEFSFWELKDPPEIISALRIRNKCVAVYFINF